MIDPALHLLRPEYLDQGGLKVTNPADGREVTTIRRYNRAELVEIVERADAARHEWGARTAKERSDVLRAWYDLMCEHAEALAMLMTLGWSLMTNWLHAFLLLKSPFDQS